MLSCQHVRAGRIRRDNFVIEQLAKVELLRPVLEQMVIAAVKVDYVCSLALFRKSCWHCQFECRLDAARHVLSNRLAIPREFWLPVLSTLREVAKQKMWIIAELLDNLSMELALQGGLALDATRI
jgi:hypothetical protein